MTMTQTASDGLDLPPFLKRETPVVWFYTLLNTYDNICQYQAFRRFINKDIKFVETPAVKFGNEVHSSMEYRIGGKPLPVHMNHWEPLVAPLVERKATAEQKLGVTMEGRATGFFDKNVWGRGKLDVTLLNGTTAYLQDWKTGNVREEPFELEVQAVLLHAKHPQLQKIVGRFAWLKENRLGEMHDLSDTKTHWNKIGTIVQSIERSKATATWEKRQSGLCG
jgi:hypothetical protein